MYVQYTMKINKIVAYEKKVQREVQKAINAIYKKHNRVLIDLIAEQIPKGKTMICGNGMAIIGEETGRAWRNLKIDADENKVLNHISSLQYTREFRGGFNIPNKIKSKQ